MKKLSAANKRSSAEIEEAYDLVSRTSDRLHVVMRQPVHLTHPTPHSERQFDGKPKKWCSGCPFPEGCVVCCLK